MTAFIYFFPKALNALYGLYLINSFSIPTETVCSITTHKNSLADFINV